MRTLRYLDEEKRRLKSQQTLDLMAPLARRLGLPGISDELESIARTRLTVWSADARATYQARALGTFLLPPAARARYLDEWLGELDTLPDRPARTRFALRLTQHADARPGIDPAKKPRSRHYRDQRGLRELWGYFLSGEDESRRTPDS